MDHNEQVQEFLTTAIPNKDTIVNAYVARDTIMELDFNEMKQKHIRKLGYTLDKIDEYQAKKQEEYVINNITQQYGEYIKDGNYNEINIEMIVNNYKDSVDYQQTKQTVDFRIGKFNKLASTETVEDLYNSLNVNELKYLGW